MYHYECDYCGARINVQNVPYVTAAITFITGNQDRLGNPEKLVEPTRFFHAHSTRGLEECDRLGIEVNAEKLGDCCYTRALKQLEGVPVTDPGKGLEWRLVPAESEQKRAASGKSHVVQVAVDADLTDFLETLATPHRTRTRRALGRAGIHTLDEVAARSDDELMALEGIGGTLRCKLRAFIAAREKAQVTA
jgi:hypothetical protein